MKLNAFDKFISFVSPKSAYERMMYRETIKALKDAKRGYDAGSDSRLNANWRVVNSNAETLNRGYRDVIRARSQDLERNSDILESILLAFERNVVGTGFKLQAKTDNEELNKQIEALFKKWSRPKYCDVTQQQSFVEICQMLVRRRRVDGAAFVVKRYQDNNFIPFTLQVYEVEDLDIARVSSQYRIIDGIEYNEFNRPVAYYIKKYDLFGNWTGNSDRIPADNVLFMYRKRRPSQLREMSELSTTLPRVRDMNQYMEAVSVKERVAALLAVMIKRILPNGGAGFGRGAGGSDKSIEYQGKKLTPGMIMELNPGDDVSVITPPSSGASAADFVRLQQRLTGSAQGISYEVAARDMSQVNYSSARQGLLEDRSTYEMEQQFFKDHFLVEVYEEFIEAAVLSGALNIKDFYTNKEAYLKHEWIAPGMKWIDPKKEADANKVMLDNNLTTLEQVAASTGQDWREIIDQRAIELEYAAAKGVITNAESQTAVTDEKDETEESDDGTELDN